MTTRFVGALAAALLLLAAAAPAQAATLRIPGDPLEVWVADDGDLQARFIPNPTTTREALPLTGFFFPPSSNPGNAGFWLRFANGPAAGTTHGHRGSTEFVAVSNGPVTGNFTPSSPAQVESVYEARQAGTPIARVRQVTRYTNTQRQFRVTWIVSNLLGEPLRFRAGFGSDLYVDGNDSGTGTFIDGPQRFAGGTNPSSRFAGGALEVAGSRLTSESTDTPVPPWTSFQVTNFGQTANAGNTAQGCSPTTINANLVDNGVCFQWEDRFGEGNGLPTQFTTGQTARYEVIFQVRRPTPIRLSPATASRELPGRMEVVGRLVDRNENGVPGETVAFQRTGANPSNGVEPLTSGPDGLFTIPWNGDNAGTDTVTAWIELGARNGVRDPGEPAATSVVRWYANNNIDGPPEVGQGTRADGQPLEVTSSGGEGGEPDSAFLNVRRGQFGGDAPRCGSGNAGFVASLPVSVSINPGSGSLVGSPRLFAQSPSLGPPTESTGGGLTGTQDGTRHTFTLPCAERADLFVRYTLDEGGTQQTFVIPVGQITLIDPQGVVYNRAAFDARRAAGDSEEAARAAAAITGATVVLQRRGTDGVFRRVLSGDPGIAPNINPQVTRGNGLFQWDVEAGTWRVVVSAPGCVTQESRAVDIPPPVLDLHMGMDCGALPSGGTTPFIPGRAAPRPAPVSAARVLRARYDRRRGLLAVTMLAPAPGEVRGVATARRRGTRFLALTTGRRPRRPRVRTVRVGSRRVTVARAGQVVVRMRLSRAVRRARRARVRYALTFRPRSGRAQVLRGSITVRAARRARGRR